jgi:hypothetical protein
MSYGPGDNPHAPKVRTTRNAKRVRRDAEAAQRTNAAKAQAQQYVSEGKAVEKVANQQRQTARARVRAEQRTSTPPVTDAQSSGDDYGMRQARHAARTAPIGRAVRQTYMEQPVAQRQRIIRGARGPVREAILSVHQARETANALADVGDVIIAHGHHPRNPLEHDAVRLARARQERVGKRAAAAALKAAGHMQPLEAPRAVSTEGIGGALDSLLSGKATAGAVQAAGNVVSKAFPYLALGAAGPTGAAEHLFVGKVTGLDKPAKRILQNAGRELVDLPANAIPSLYVPAREAARGDVGGAAGMLAQPFKELYEHPGRQLEEHPVSSGLMIAGGLRGADRAVGAATRKVTGTVGERPAATLPGTQLEQVRPAAKGAVWRAVQQRRDAAHGAPVMSEREIARRVDETFAADEDIRRAERAQAHREARQAVTNTVPVKGTPGERVRAIMRNRQMRTKPTAATVTMAQNITTASRADIAGYLQELEGEAPRLTGARAKANANARKQLQAALSGHDAGRSEIAARRFAALSVRQQNDLVRAGLLAPEQAERARLIPYAVRRMGATHDRQGGVLDAEGKPLSNAAIRAHMREHNVSEPAFVPQGPGARGARNFFVPTSAPPRISGAVRTGAATREGTADLHPDVLAESAVRAQGLITTAKRYPKFLGEFGLRSRSGKLRGFTTHKLAADVAADLHENTGIAWRPVRVSPFAASKLQTDTLLQRGSDVSHPAYQQVHDALHSALEGDGKGPWVLIPEAAARRAQEHIRTYGPGAAGRIGNLYGSAFRRTVLALSPKWLTGNVVEAALRSMVAHAGPRAYLTGRRVLKRLEAIDPDASAEARARTIGGGHYSLGMRSTVHTNAEHFAGTRLARIATVLGKVRRTPGPKQAVNLWHAYTDFVFNVMNGRIETQFQTAMLGKALRDSPLMNGHMVKLSQDAVEQAARGLHGTNAQVALGREVDRMYGRYGKFSPGMKRAVAAYTPFIAWTLNATRFVLDVLPRDHPVATALLASAYQASEKWRDEHGLALWGDRPVPGFLQGSIPLSGDTKLRVSRYTPFGAFGDPTDTAAGAVLPQAESVLANLQGQDWRGRELKHPDGTPYDQYERALAAAVTLVEGSIPGVAQADRYAHREGSPASRLRAEFDPFKATAPAGGSSSGSVTSGDAAATVPPRVLRRAQRAASRVPSQAEIDRLVRRAQRAAGAR